MIYKGMKAIIMFFVLTCSFCSASASSDTLRTTLNVFDNNQHGITILKAFSRLDFSDVFPIMDECVVLEIKTLKETQVSIIERAKAASSLEYVCGSLPPNTTVEVFRVKNSNEEIYLARLENPLFPKSSDIYFHFKGSLIYKISMR